MRPTIIAGPCVIEHDGSWLADFAAQVRDALPAGTPFILKASFDKANRTSNLSFRGIGLEKGLHALYLARQQGFAVTTDIHEPWQAERVAGVVDIIQIPQLLCRQQDLLAAAGKACRTVNIKCGVSVSPAKMQALAHAAEDAGATRVWLTYRGTAFGNELVFDPARFCELRDTGKAVFADITHSTQVPAEVTTRGRRFLAGRYALVATALGCDGIFAEVHPNPPKALSDSSTQLTVEQLGFIARSILL